jgi:hypothetical protein
MIFERDRYRYRTNIIQAESMPLQDKHEALSLPVLFLRGDSMPVRIVHRHARLSTMIHRSPSSDANGEDTMHEKYR